MIDRTQSIELTRTNWLYHRTPHEARGAQLVLLTFGLSNPLPWGAVIGTKRGLGMSLASRYQ